MSGVLIAALAAGAGYVAGNLNTPQHVAEKSAATQETPPGDISYTGKTPGFVVKRVFPDFDELSPKSANGIQLLVYDLQHDATTEGSPRYTHQVFKAVDSLGAQQLGQYFISFDPSFQRAEINHLTITRDGEISDRSEGFTITYAQREELAEFSILTGHTTGIIRIDDIRPGDILDIGVTIIGEPPRFGRKHSDIFPASSGAEIGLFSLTSTWPGPIKTSPVLSGVTPTKTQKGEDTVLEINPQPLTAIETSELVRAPFSLNGSIMVSDFGSWKNIVEWATDDYRPTQAEELQSIAQKITLDHDSASARAVAALRFVQNEIRYSASLFGNGGYTPQTVDETLRSRAGDCKAKALLLVSLLDMLGFEAHAALANTTDGIYLDYYPPTPLAFDHVIVRFSVDGRHYWADPTLLYQAGDLASMAQPNYGHALVLEPYSVGLTEMGDATTTPAPITEIREFFDLSKGASEGLADVVFIYRRDAANLMRAALNAISEEEFVKNFSNYYKRYGDVEILEQKVSDEPENNQIDIAMKMTLSKPFDAPDKENKRYFEYKAHAITQILLLKPDDDPLIRLPILQQPHAKHVVQISLPEGITWRLPPEEETISNDTFFFSYSYSADSKMLTFESNLKTKAISVEPKQYDQLVQDDDALQDAIDRNIWFRKNTSQEASTDRLIIENVVNAPKLPPMPAIESE